MRKNKEKALKWLERTVERLEEKNMKKIQKTVDYHEYFAAKQ